MSEGQQLCEAGHPEVPGLACTRTAPCQFFHSHRPSGTVWALEGAPGVAPGAMEAPRSRRVAIAAVAGRMTRVEATGTAARAVADWYEQHPE